jgi:hypothetical protein
VNNGKLLNLEERLAKLEQTVQTLQKTVEANVPVKDWRAFVGSHENDPVFAEIVRLGAEWRQAERDKYYRSLKRKAKARRKAHS